MLTEDADALLEYIDKDCTMLVLTAFADPTYPDPVTGAIDEQSGHPGILQNPSTRPWTSRCGSRWTGRRAV